MRQREPEGDDILVQHRDPDLDARAHAHHVHLAQHVGRQTDLEQRLGQTLRQLLEVGHAGRVVLVVVTPGGQEPVPGDRAHQVPFVVFAQVVREPGNEERPIARSDLGELHRLRDLTTPVSGPPRERPASQAHRVAQPGGEPHELDQPVGPPEPRVPAERLVAAVARQRADDALIADRPGDPVHRQEAQVGERLIEVAQQIEHRVGAHIPVPEVDRAVGGAAVPGDRDRDRGLVVALGGESHIERRGRPAGGPAVRRDDERAVDAAAEQGGHRHIGDGLPSDGVEQGVFHVRGRLVQPAGVVGPGRHLVETHPVRSGGVDRQRRPLGDGLDIGEPGRRLGHVAQAEKVVARLAVDRRAEPRQGEDRFDLTGEHPLAVVERVEQGLHAEPVAREVQGPPARVINRESENAPQPTGHALAVLLVEVHEHFRVRGAAEPMTPALELAPQISMVVDLAVEDDVDTAVLVGHRLVPCGREVDQRQPAVDELAPVVAVVPLAIRTAVSEQRRHPGGPAGRAAQGDGVEPARDAAHVRSPPWAGDRSPARTRTSATGAAWQSSSRSC